MKAEGRKKATGSPTGEAKRRLIVQGATKVFARRGVALATVREIADEVGILSGSLYYYYFDSKDDIAEEIVADYLTRTLRASRAALEDAVDGVDGVRRLVDTAIRGVVQDRWQVILLHNDWRYLRTMPSVASGTQEIERVWMEWIDQGVADGSLRQASRPG